MRPWQLFRGWFTGVAIAAMFAAVSFSMEQGHPVVEDTTEVHEHTHTHDGVTHTHQHHHDCVPVPRPSAEQDILIDGPISPLPADHHCCEDHQPPSPTAWSKSDRKRDDHRAPVAVGPYLDDPHAWTTTPPVLFARPPPNPKPPGDLARLRTVVLLI